MDYPKSLPNAGLVGGKFVDEDTGAGTPGSLIPAVWGNGITDEVLNVIKAAGDVPDETKFDQLLQAIQKLGGSAVGSMRNVRMNVAAASETANLTADEVVVATGLGGRSYRLASINKTINLAAVGAGGMDTGSAPANSFVSIYAIYNPSTQESALLACNQSVSSGSIYTGGNMPSGYTASALVSAWRTSSTGLLVAGSQTDRAIDVALATIINTTSVLTNSTVSMNSILPIAAVSFSGVLQCGAASANSSVTVGLASTPSGLGIKSCGATITVASAVTQCTFSDMALPTSRTTYVSSTVDIGSISQAAAFLTSYKI